MSESRILVIDADAPRAERLAGLLEFMDLTPRWVASAGDVDVRRQRPHDWLAVVVGTVDDQKAADAFFAWLGKAQLPPPVLLLEGDTAAFAAAHGLHEAGVWTLESPIRHAQLEACLRRASLKRRPKLVSTMYGFYPINKYSQALLDVDTIITVSDSVTNYLKKGLRREDLEPKVIKRIYRGVDTRRYPYRHNPSVYWLRHTFAEYPELGQ